MSTFTYDYIISGMGCAGLSLAVHLSEAGLTKGKRILLIDREQKNLNDRTWCFWETEAGLFEPIVYRSWEKAWFYGHTSYDTLLDLDPYNYKMIRGIDFYAYCLQRINSDPAFDIRYEGVRSIHSEKGYGSCETDQHIYRADVIFNSIQFREPVKKAGKHYLLQHFKGWIIETEKDRFDPSVPTLMDFRPDQKWGTAFVYVMPFTTRKALVEYTLFTASLLREEDYREGLTQYIQSNLQCDKWNIIEEEFGVIPMTNHSFMRFEEHILHLGTAGGRTKPSSGYTFTFIQKDCRDIIKSIQSTGVPFRIPKSKSRFHWYDSVLLNVLSTGKLSGHRVFTELFKNNPPDQILRFLDNETTLAEELRILTSLPQWPFMKAGMEELMSESIS